MNFANITDWIIPEGSVTQVTDSLNRVIWQKTPTPPVLNSYFYVEDVSGSANTLTIKKQYNSSPTIRVYYSTDQQTWVSMGNTSYSGITATIPANGKLYLKATANTWCTYDGTYDNQNAITVSGDFNVGGNIMSLLYGDDFENKTTFPTGSDRNFLKLFYHASLPNNHLINAKDLVLPATTLTSHCYTSMLYACSSLTTAPALPATTLASNCYYQMFYGCTSLTTAPANMLPATTLADNCYSNMFRYCSSLTTAPTLPATTLAERCYIGMFYGCTNLNSVTTYAQDISATNCIANWLNGVAATGDFYNLGGATYPSGASGIPSGWTIHTSL